MLAVMVFAFLISTSYYYIFKVFRVVVWGRYSDINIHSNYLHVIKYILHFMDSPAFEKPPVTNYLWLQLSSLFWNIPTLWPSQRQRDRFSKPYKPMGKISISETIISTRADYSGRAVLRHEMSSTARTLGSWVRIPLKACMPVWFILCLLDNGFAMGWSPVQGVLTV
jgi:hypothetical protein